MKRIHLTAVCGTAMGALACLLKEMGYIVTGSDKNIYPPMSIFLEKNGIKVARGFSAKNLDPPPDLVVIGNAVSASNEEAVAVRKTGIEFCSMPEAINRFVVANKKSVVVCGTHGKTTTSAIVAWILHCAGLNPSFVIGGILKNFKSNYLLGKGEYVVLEGDEYDTAFFDKGPKFMHYNPLLAILNSVEFDHADIFKDFGHVKKAFCDFVSKMPENSFLSAVTPDDAVDEIVSSKQGLLVRFGTGEKALWKLGRVSFNPAGTSFEILKGSFSYGTFSTQLVGRHNLANILAAVSACDFLGVKRDAIASALSSFRGVKRRQEIVGTAGGITVIDDFAHHPTAVRETSAAVKQAFSDRRLICVFEPRTNSSMRKVFEDDYPGSFDAGDVICVRKPPLLHKIPENERFSSINLVRRLRRRGKEAYYFSGTDSIIRFLSKKAAPGDIILVMSNGGFDNIHERLMHALSLGTRT